MNGRGHRFDGERFSETGDAFEKNMAVREKTEEEPVDQILLTDHDMANLFAQGRNPLPELLHFVSDFLR